MPLSAGFRPLVQRAVSCTVSRGDTQLRINHLAVTSGHADGARDRRHAAGKHERTGSARYDEIELHDLLAAAAVA
jgi:hypothetical protein